ncbi:MAG: YceI family protein [Salibacteraceae bacterium]
MKSLSLLAATLISAISINAQSAKSWNLDKSHASVVFTIDHFFTGVTGKFKKFDGTFNFDPENLKGSKATFTIQVASVDTDNEDRDSHLQSEDFFAAEQYPTIKFESTSFSKTGDNQYMVKGNLTMRGETKPIDFPMTIKGVMDNPWKEGSVIMGVEINSTLDRTNWGVGTGNWAATSVVSDEVEFSISMELDGKK